MEHVTLDPANNLGTVERRRCLRLPVSRLAVSYLIYVKLSNGNGGIALNISEGGLALSAANGLLFDLIPELSIQLPDSGAWIRTPGHIAWRSNSNKKCGVRFVGMDEADRKRIREWIAAETSSTGAAAEPEGNDELGSNNAFQNNVELQSTAPTPGDTVASIEKEDEDALNAVPAAEVGGHCVLQEAQPESEFPATEATAFTEEKTEDKVVADLRTPPAQVVAVNPYYAEAVLDRRVHPRKQVIPLGYVQLGGKNGGIALNVSEGGFSIIAANVLLEDNLPSIRLQFPDNTRWVDVKGEIVWRSESKKEAGVRFVDLPEQARRQLGNWLSSPVRRLAVERQTELIGRREKTEVPVTALSAPELSSQGPILNSPPAEAPEKVPESSPPPVVNTSDISSPPAAHPRVKSRARSKPVKRHRRVTRVRIKGGGGWKNRRVLFRALIATVALLVLVGWPPSTKHWFYFRPHGTNRMVEIVPPKQLPGTEVAEVVPQSPPANAAKASQPQLLEAPRAPKGKPASPKNSAIASMPPIPLKDLPDRVEGAQRPLAATVAKEPVHDLRKLPRLNHGNTESLAAAGSVASLALPVDQLPVPGAPPPRWPHEEARLAPVLIPVVSPPRNVEAAGSEKNSTKNSTKNGGESPSLPRSTESAVRINGTVAITTDPYPSIRFSGKPKAKKSRGGTSLRLGQLVSRVEPAYPEEAMQKGAQGTVKIHAIVSPEGSIERMVSIDGPPLLVPATVRAVQQWRYSQTLLAGQPVETEDNIAVTFGLSTGINR